jgi:oxygen-independent coproporphyrinogen-3 oxidase
MAGIYIHIPYCKKACNYCNFHFSTNLKTKSDLIKAIIHQIKTDDFVKDKDIQTIYFGGGTPSVLSKDELEAIMSCILDHFSISEGTEITLEANPDDILPETISFWHSAGVNRISLGVQSFFDKDLEFMNRAHNADQALSSILLLQNAGFDNITIDLIYGGPETTNEMWIHNLKTAIDSGVPHISSYCLTVEQNTTLAWQVKKGKVIIDEQRASDQFEILINTLTNAGFEHYEISNFAKPGYLSKHNTAYWQNKTYHGFGPGAHSYNGLSRKWMIANNPQYIENITLNKPCHEEEFLSTKDQYNEYIMTRLRTQWGVTVQEVQDKFGTGYLMNLKSLISKIDQELIIYDEIKLLLSHKGKFYADRIASDLFYV